MEVVSLGVWDSFLKNGKGINTKIQILHYNVLYYVIYWDGMREWWYGYAWGWYVCVIYVYMTGSFKQTYYHSYIDLYKSI